MNWYLYLYHCKIKRLLNLDDLFLKRLSPNSFIKFETSSQTTNDIQPMIAKMSDLQAILEALINLLPTSMRH